MRRVLVFIPLVSLALFQMTSSQQFQSFGDIAGLSVLVITNDFRDRWLIDSLQQSLAVVAGEVDYVSSSAEPGLVADLLSLVYCIELERHDSAFMTVPDQPSASGHSSLINLVAESAPPRYMGVSPDRTSEPHTLSLQDSL